MKTKMILLVLLGCSLFGVGLVVVLFLMSEEKMQRNNAFQRRYVPHPVAKAGEYELGYNSYYLAGIDDSTIYLGNVTAPFLLKTLSHSLKESKDHPIVIDSTELRFQRVRLAVRPPYFYLGDGTVPVIFRGRLGDWEADIHSYKEAYFTSFTVADSLQIGFVTLSSKTGSKALGVLQVFADKDTIVLNTDILNTRAEKRFGADGMLLWNHHHRQFIYVYYYRNSYEVSDEGLVEGYTGKTIDTITTPQIDVTYFAKDAVYKRGKSVMVNRQASTYGDYLYIHSDRLGSYESEEPLRSASIIDIYKLSDSSYSFSFYLYHQPGNKLRDFMVYKGFLVALVGDMLWFYRLKPRYFGLD